MKTKSKVEQIENFSEKVPAPTRPLGERGLEWREKAIADYIFETHNEFSMLDEAAHCLDEISRFTEIVASEGRIMLDRFDQKREHPAVKSARDYKLLFLKYVKALGLEPTDDSPKNPPGRPSPWSDTGRGKF